MCMLLSANVNRADDYRARQFALAHRRRLGPHDASRLLGHDIAQGCCMTKFACTLGINSKCPAGARACARRSRRGRRAELPPHRLHRRIFRAQAIGPSHSASALPGTDDGPGLETSAAVVRRRCELAMFGPGANVTRASRCPARMTACAWRCARRRAPPVRAGDVRARRERRAGTRRVSASDIELECPGALPRAHHRGVPPLHGAGACVANRCGGSTAAPRIVLT